MVSGLALFSRLAGGSTAPALLGSDLLPIARKYRRGSRAVGGYYIASFMLSEEDLSRAQLTELYNLWLGCRLVETSFVKESWEGQIVEMRLFQDGVEMMQALYPDLLKNRVKALYQDTVGSQADTGWDENEDSSDIYGTCEWVEVLGGATSTGATMQRDSLLTDFAWPRSRIVGGDARCQGNEEVIPDLLQVMVGGYWGTLNWTYRTSSTTDGASDLVETLVGESEFVTTGRIETNADSVRVDCFPIPRRRGDVLREIIKQGDSSKNVWQGGVYEDRKFVYEPAPTDWTYQLRDGELLDKAGVAVVLSLVKPGFLLYNPSAPTGWPRPGTASLWDNPEIRYVDEVEYVVGEKVDELLMRYYGVQEGAAAVTARRIQGGNL